MMRITALLLLLAVQACTTAPSLSPCSHPMLETKLFFGLSRPDGRSVTAREFETFVTREIVHRFPEGFTIVDGTGRWFEAQSKRTITEKTRILIRLHGATDAEKRAIDEIAQGYKQTFHQESVLRTDSLTCPTF
ncbi:MAG: DUF3574 domain-containing protein [Micropepsaceae bacterium]